MEYANRCGRPIDPQRLKALPETRLCVRCKNQMEPAPRPNAFADSTPAAGLALFLPQFALFRFGYLFVQLFEQSARLAQLLAGSER